MSRVLVIPDLQAPFQHELALDHLCRIRDKHKCDFFINIGDEADFKFLKYLSINDQDSALIQHKKALAFLKKLYYEFPDVYVCHSNHVKDRIVNVADKASIPEFMLKDIPELLEAPKGWHWNDQWFVDDVKYVHGHRITGGIGGMKKAVDENFSSVVYGHHALMGIQYFLKGNNSYFGMCVASLTVNPLGKAKMAWGLRYAKKYGNPMPIGCGVVIDGELAFVEPLIEG